MNIAIVGATGVVGRKVLQVLKERKIKYKNLYLFASANSAGEVVRVGRDDIKVEELCGKNIVAKQIDVAIFVAGGEVSKHYAPFFKGFIIDNSSAFRMQEGVPLVIPEVNPEVINETTKLIANPNCTTIIALTSLNNLAKQFGLKRVVFNTYQAISGAGKVMVDDFLNNSQNKVRDNIIPFIDKEEEKMVDESRKILKNKRLAVSATCVRVPVVNGHSISINAQFKKPFTKEEIIETLKATDGIVLSDNPMPKLANNGDEVLVGRVRIDESQKNTINMFVCGDNIRKGAATNAVQILDLLIKEGLVK